MRIITIWLAAFIALWCNAQTPELPTDYRSEQIYLAPERTMFQPGDSIRIEGVVTCIAGDRMLPYSRYLYLELINGSDIVLKRQKIACDDRGYFRAVVPTDSVTLGMHFLRAYTRLMRNFSPGSFAQQPVVFSRDRQSTHGSDYMRCSVSADGGVLIPDMPQKITAALYTTDGIPLSGEKIALERTDGTVMESTVTSASGFATFNFIPAGGEKYRLKINGKQEVSIPMVDAEAVKIEGRLNGDRLTFGMSGKLPKPSQRRLIVYDRMNGLSEIDASDASGSITLRRVPATATLFLIDPDNRILAEYTSVNISRSLPTIALADTLHAGSAIDYRIEHMACSGNGVTTIARIAPVDVPAWATAQEALVYCSDLRSDLPFPALIQSGSPTEHAADLTAWAGTARFDRFSLPEVMANDSTIYMHMPETALEFKGTAYRDKRFPFRKGSVVAYNSANFYAYDVPVSHEGEFSFTVDDFEENTDFFLQYINNAGRVEHADMHIASDTYPPAKITHQLHRRNGTLRRSGVDIGDEVEGSHRLPNVEVKARAVTDKPVSSKRFYGIRAKYRDDIEKRNYIFLLDILNDMPTIRVIKEQNPEGGPKWRIVTMRGAITTNMKGGVKLLIDGSLCDDTTILDIWLNMPAMDIESVEYLSPAEALAYTSFAIDGAILVKSRQLGPQTPRVSKGTLYRPTGLTVAKQFDSPKVPDKPGHYRLTVDVIGPEGVHSMERLFTVVE